MELTYDSEANTLRLVLPVPDEPADPAFVKSIDGILDIGENGRLIGIEFDADEGEFHLWLIDPVAGGFSNLDTNDRAYIQISPDDGNFRSTELPLTAEFNAYGEIISLIIPRRGSGYEITYPSGNQ